MPKISSREASITLDATDASWGRLASRVSSALRGKHLPQYAPQLLPRVVVTVTNLRSVHLTARDRARMQYHFSGYPGGLKFERFGVRFDRDAGTAFRKTVRAMLPANRQRDRILKHLRFR